MVKARYFLVAAFLLSLSFAALASGTLYKWVDRNGKTHISDTLTADAIKRGYFIINEKGRVIEKVGRKKTERELRQSNQEAVTTDRGQ